MKQTKKPYWNKWRIGYMILWLVAVIYCWNWIQSHPCDMNFDLTRVTYDGYIINSCGCDLPIKFEFNNECHETIGRYPLAYKIYNWQKQYGSMIKTFAWIATALWIAINWNYLRGSIKKLK